METTINKEITMKAKVLINDSMFTRCEEGILNNGEVLRYSELSRDEINDLMEKGSAPAMTVRGFEELAPATWINDLFIDAGTYEVQADSATQACDQIFQAFGNNFDGSKPEGYNGRSLSVGDVVVVDGTAYACEAFGWKEITGPIFDFNIA
jgi:hypothetical protein